MDATQTTTRQATTWSGGLATDDLGRTDGRPPLVLLHGLTFDRTTWCPIIAELQRIDPGRRVVAIDLPGHGRSPDQPAYELDAIVEQIHRVVRDAGLTAPVLVGHSASGGFASVYAARHPSRGVVNIDSPLQIEPFITLLQSQGTAALRDSGIPYLFIAGDDLDPDYRQWLSAHLPTATIEVWPRTGHFPHLADPSRFAQLLVDWTVPAG